MINKRPSFIVRPNGIADVMAAIRFASDRGLAVSARGGGHNIAAASVCEGGLMIDMSLRRAVRVDPVNAGFIRADVRYEDDVRNWWMRLWRASAVSTQPLTMPVPKENVAL